MRKIIRSKASRVSDEIPLRNKILGRGYAYARKWLEDPDPAIGTAPYSEIDAQTLMQWAWAEGYNDALKDARNGVRCLYCLSPDPDNLHADSCPQAKE